MLASTTATTASSDGSSSSSSSLSSPFAALRTPSATALATGDGSASPVHSIKSQESGSNAEEEGEEEGEAEEAKSRASAAAAATASTSSACSEQHAHPAVSATRLAAGTISAFDKTAASIAEAPTSLMISRTLGGALFSFPLACSLFSSAAASSQRVRVVVFPAPSHPVSTATRRRAGSSVGARAGR